ncbi:GNAT family N-acetyltransferase [Haemophilus paracuniculus]|uniref:GNAT family N-acetyltransferase n=1 Tax=Haemophilus paracuniculus TaxID=734 RepID=A0A1T0AVE7_9PAST|nr:GNAT family N-acetyltransferase [Haemophilus paracuniculus]
MSAPILLEAHHQTQSFDCGEEVLNQWLKRKALKNQHSRASRTFVVVDQQQRVMGYYAMSSGAVTHIQATGNIRRNMPDPIPVIILARLAVDQQMQGQQLGAALLKDAVLRAKQVSEQIGVRALLVHALNDTAKNFYLQYGFVSSPIDDLTLMLKL